MRLTSPRGENRETFPGDDVVCGTGVDSSRRHGKRYTPRALAVWGVGLCGVCRDRVGAGLGPLFHPMVVPERWLYLKLML